jgi:hypothetical protein
MAGPPDRTFCTPERDTNALFARLSQNPGQSGRTRPNTLAIQLGVVPAQLSALPATRCSRFAAGTQCTSMSRRPAKESAHHD